MNKLFTIIVIVSSIFVASAAQAEVVPCRSSPTGYCEVHSAPRPAVQVGVAVRANVGVNAGVVVGGNIGYAGYGQYGREQHRTYRQEGRCKDGGIYEETIGACVRSAPPTADIANDPDCVGKPRGYRFDVPVRGPHGEEGRDHRVCG